MSDHGETDVSCDSDSDEEKEPKSNVPCPKLDTFPAAHSSSDSYPQSCNIHESVLPGFPRPASTTSSVCKTDPCAFPVNTLNAPSVTSVENAEACWGARPNMHMNSGQNHTFIQRETTALRIFPQCSKKNRERELAERFQAQCKQTMTESKNFLTFEQQKPRNAHEVLNRTSANVFNPHQFKIWLTRRVDAVLIFEISNNTVALCNWLQQDFLQFESLLSFINLLHKVMNSVSQKSSQALLLKAIAKTKFFEKHLTNFFTQLQNHSEYANVFGWINKIVDIAESAMFQEEQCRQKCKPCLSMVLSKAEYVKLHKDNELLERIKHLLDQSESDDTNNQYLITVKPQFRMHRLPLYKIAPNNDEDSPPDDYSTMKIFPEMSELKSSVKPFLRANLTHGSYRDVDHYLDIQARLLKEDYIEPIRHGLQDYYDYKQGQKLKENNLRFYWNVHVVKMGYDSSEGATHFVKFDTTEFEKMEFDWKATRRLLFGSLLCFSKDDFQSTMFAIVAENDTRHLQRGILQVVFQNELEKVFTISENDEFVMGETTAYFESYRHVLEGLQEMQRIPLDRYIIYCDRNISKPQYLHQGMVYDIQCITEDGIYESIHVMDPKQWPDAEDTCLNEWQLEAVKTCLTKEMAIIQGPPGTGKTYVGLKVMRILLDTFTNNARFERKSEPPKSEMVPILVVCYTNNALDQFLEGVLEFCPSGVVRVGGRSSSETLEPFNLKKLREQKNLKGKIWKQIQVNLRQCRYQLRTVSEHIDFLWKTSLSLETTIINIKELWDEMDDHHVTSLTDPRRATGTHVMSQWLKASSVNMDNYLFTAAQQHLAKLLTTLKTTQSDSDITNEKEALKKRFESRAKIYNGWLTKYRDHKYLEVQRILEEQSSSLSLNSLYEAIIRSKFEILDDNLLIEFMTNDIVFEAVKKCVITEKTEGKENRFVSQWLLGLFPRTDQLLDAIELICSLESGSGKNRTSPEYNEISDHWIIGESDEDDSSDREDIDMGDIDDDDKTTVNLPEFKERFKQNENKDIVMLQRARMLGIDIKEEPEKDGDEWQTNSDMTYRKVFNLYHKAKPFHKEEIFSMSDLWSLKLKDRYRLYKYWVLMKKEKLTNKIIDLVHEYKLLLEQKKEASSYKDVAILKNSKVIGMTTTGAAKNRKVLQDVGCRIIVIEEAAEVLEAHIVTTLSDNCQHLILIGDHQQLRPTPTVHRLAVDYKLEISLFERLIQNQLHHVTLQEQHRMRPEISGYMHYEYSALTDHDSVLGHSNIDGVASNVFFLQHNHEETTVEDTPSKANQHEAKFLTFLCRYFLQHGYDSSKITILAAYSGQVNLIKSMLDEILGEQAKIYVTSVDSYQGNENDIILVSLVRSNKENQVGFLKIHNRVVVAMSRAKKGMFVIGNIKMLTSKSAFWMYIMDRAQERNETGVRLKLQCVNHEHHVTYVMNAEDFNKEVPEGGCYRDCNFQLPCGHVCPRKCHASDRKHVDTLCKETCLKTCPEGHPCQFMCYQECEQCLVMVTKTIPFCGHKDKVACFLSVEDAICSQICNVKMVCEHICRGQCGKCAENGEHAPCEEKVMKEWPCKHKNVAKCSTDTTVDLCPKKCVERLSCSHMCGGSCGGCLGGRVHRACVKDCGMTLPCGHTCKSKCGTDCQPCTYRCISVCRHGGCSNRTCGELCTPCTEDCEMKCKHRTCSERCMDECKTSHCNKRCGQIVTECKHKCSSLCGEVCVCFQCEKGKFTLIDFNTKKKPKHVVAHDQLERAKKFELTTHVILMKIPRCRHIFTLSQLDKYVEECDPTGTSYIKCPVCKATTIQTINRYDKKNKERTDRRENLKKVLLRSKEVSEQKIHKLKASVKLVDDFFNADEGDFLDFKEKQIDTNHALALTLKIRFAYTLHLIKKLHEEYDDDHSLDFVKLKQAVQSIQTGITLQLRQELWLELHRMLLLEEMVILNKVVKDASVSVPEALKAQCKIFFKEYNKNKLTTDEKTLFRSAIAKVYFLLDSPDTFTYKKYVDDVRTRAEMIRDVLDCPTTVDLCDIIS